MIIVLNIPFLSKLHLIKVAPKSVLHMFVPASNQMGNPKHLVRSNCFSTRITNFSTYQQLLAYC